MLIFLMGLMGFLNQFFSILALKKISETIYSSLLLTSIILSSIIDIFIFRTKMEPTQILAIFIMIFGILLFIITKHKKAL
ncbi:EamA family transporter [Francisella sp. 19X1-34]|uniref:EamA family transporter n=1 Tax=Francisella sp. 19X1-34 TaxID=3087177 RepID=UPI0034E5FC17